MISAGSAVIVESGACGYNARLMSKQEIISFLKNKNTFSYKGYLIGLVTAVVCTVIGYALRSSFSDIDIIMLYIAGTVIVAARLGRGPALFYTVLSVSLFNYFFVDPVFTFNVYNSSYWLTFAVMFFAGLVISTQASSLRDQVFLAQQREREAKLFYELKLRNVLLSSISHDLRSPLAAITGATDTLLQAASGQEGAHHRLLLSIRQEAARLTRIVNNMLDMNRIEGGQLNLNLQPYYPAEIIGSAVGACREALKEHSLAMSVPETLPLIRMDGLLFSQVMQNLLENAARHTPAGTAIKVQADIYQGGLRMTVSDNGPGIADGQENEIFDKFTAFVQGGQPKGTGLGLAICHAIITAHKGKIYAKNNVDQGCCFTIKLPAALTLADTAEAV